jgi:TPR repeat protein
VNSDATSAAEQRRAGFAAFEANRYAEAYRLLRPFADAGDPEVQGCVGSLMQLSIHRYESLEQLNAGSPTVDSETFLRDRDEGAKFLEAASRAGIGAATFNLAGLYSSGYGGGSWEERKARAAELYALAYAQGFTAFGWLTNGDGPGQPYLDLMENHGLTTGGVFPGESLPVVEE